jgi:tetratricopeptide (TPR) repeat protein
MIGNRVRRLVKSSAVVLSLVLVALASRALARGGSQGLRWGYQPPAGNPFVNMWLMTSPWSVMSGWNIPHHDLGAPDLNMGGPTQSYGTFGTSGSSRITPPVDRQSMFRGASSQTDRSYTPTQYAVPTEPYRTERHFQPPYYRAYDGYWYHGYWGGGQWGWGRWDEELGVWSLARWWAGGFYYGSGYGVYVNPFVAAEGVRPPAPLDYSTPIELPLGDEPQTSTAKEDPSGKSAQEAYEAARRELVKSPEETAGLKAFDAARDAFREKNFDLALSKSEEALRQLPRDPALHEFRGLVLFARGEYRQAAAAIYAVLSVSPGWDWTTVSSLYGDHDEYTAQLRNLEAYRKQHPQAVEAMFLSAYHYATCRHNESAVKQLRNVVKLLPEDDLSPHLLTLLTSAMETDEATAPKEGAAAAQQPDAPSAAEAPPLDPSKFVGVWRAKRSPNVGIELTLGEDGKFVWVLTRAGKTRRFEGTYEVGEDVLALYGSSGTILADVTLAPSGGFAFRLLENDPDSPPLDFTK